LHYVAGPLQCNRGQTFYDVRYDIKFVLLAAYRATGGYVTGKLKALAELQATGLTETWLKHSWQLLPSLGAHKLAPTGNQTGPS
jgi:hypothetical protein